MRIPLPQPNGPDRRSHAASEAGKPDTEEPMSEHRADNNASLQEQIVTALKQVHDPEIPVNIYDLGLVYDVDVRDDQSVHVRMTLTTPNCPEAQSIPGYVQQAVESVPGVKKANVEIVWEPQWDKEMMSDEAKLQLGFM